MTNAACQASTRDSETETRSVPSLRYAFTPGVANNQGSARAARLPKINKCRRVRNPIAQEEKTKPASDPRRAPREKVASTPTKHASAARKYPVRHLRNTCA